MNIESEKRGESRERGIFAHGFEIAGHNLTIYWGDHPYELVLLDVDTPEKALSWVVHIGRKSWRGMTPLTISKLLEALATRFGWRAWP